jgi:type I restriction enzyme S subunit
MTPEGWTTAPIGDLFELQLGKMLNKEATSKNPQFPYLGNREVQWGRFDLSNLREMHFSEDERTKFSLRVGDLLVCEGGRVGRTAIWKGGFECYFQKALHRLRPLSGDALSEFMLHFLRFAAVTGKLSVHTTQSSIAHLTREKLSRVAVLLPPLPEQRKIAAILSSVDEAVEKTQAVIEQLQVVKKAMMRELLTRGLPGRHTRFKMTEIGEVPEEWEVVRLGAICTVVRGRMPRPAGDPKFFRGDFVPWVTVGELSKDQWPYLVRTATCLTEEGAKWSRLLPSGTLVISNSGSGCGVPKILEISGCANDGIAALLHLGPGIDSLFLYFTLLSMTEHLKNVVARGVDQPSLNTFLLREQQVPLPHVEEQLAISGALLQIDKRLQSELEYLDRLTELKSALMSVLLTGEVRVKVAQEDRPQGAI